MLALDNMITGAEANVAHLKGNPKFKLENTNVSDSNSMNVQGEVGYVLNFASPASPPDYLKHPIETMG